MFLTVQEMTALCVFHTGTVSATLDLLRQADNETPERMAVIEKLVEKLSSLKDDETVSLAFDSEQ